MALEREFDYYQKNMTEIREKYLGKEIVIVRDQINAAYDNVEEAYYLLTLEHLQEKRSNREN